MHTDQQLLALTKLADERRYAYLRAACIMRKFSGTYDYIPVCEGDGTVSQRNHLHTGKNAGIPRCSILSGELQGEMGRCTHDHPGSAVCCQT